VLLIGLIGKKYDDIPAIISQSSAGIATPMKIPKKILSL